MKDKYAHAGFALFLRCENSAYTDDHGLLAKEAGCPAVQLTDRGIVLVDPSVPDFYPEFCTAYDALALDNMIPQMLQAALPDSEAEFVNNFARTVDELSQEWTYRNGTLMMNCHDAAQQHANLGPWRHCIGAVPTDRYDALSERNDVYRSDLALVSSPNIPRGTAYILPCPDRLGIIREDREAGSVSVVIANTKQIRRFRF